MLHEKEVRRNATLPEVGEQNEAESRFTTECRSAVWMLCLPWQPRAGQAAAIAADLWLCIGINPSGGRVTISKGQEQATNLPKGTEFVAALAAPILPCAARPGHERKKSKRITTTLPPFRRTFQLSFFIDCFTFSVRLNAKSNPEGGFHEADL